MIASGVRHLKAHCFVFPDSHLCQAAKTARVVELVHDQCFVERGDGMVLLSRRLPSGRVLHVDTLDGAMLWPSIRV